ncbi:DUF1735 domain-containing protein [Saccharicrinis fermentans]|uniref:BT-3987-like N-terminal domain-containing protein n=1 Tax=Saccharicrinis fermentans DSM 9555 = JCM 21142 TaxID=869213 RepID=W7YLT2_9BACT|nr:DUF1735 domain-containing protein [Saccharicrinis fermentans]GAF03334.1 hypothetical protein JCM21142_42002 [Saccharicrinis fermentans DSM 9555 = JCM 21142]
MKYINFKYHILFALILIVSACKYDDFVEDYEYCAIYFANETIDRSIIVDEYNYIQVGVVLGGKIANNKEEWVSYHLNPDTATSLGYTILPEAYYTITNSLEEKDANTFYIPKGDMMGLIKVTLTDDFLNDTIALSGQYALGFELDNNTSADTILSDKNVTIITFKYISSQEGVYYHSGIATATDTSIIHNEKTWDLTTVGVGETLLETSGWAGYTGGDYKALIKINEDHSVNLLPIDGAFDFTDSGESTYDPETRTFYLKYNYIDDNREYHSVDTLKFRNREVDGINQWDI